MSMPTGSGADTAWSGSLTGEVLEMAFLFCRELETRGIGKGDRVMLWGENARSGLRCFLDALCAA